MNSTAAQNPPILLVEDCEEDFDTVREALRQSGRTEELIRASTGDEGLELLGRLTATGRQPRLVLLDLNTPGNDGRELLSVVKSAPAFHGVRVVVLTTSSNPRDLDFCRAAGADAYHMKPFQFTEHLRLVKQILGCWLDGAPQPPSEDPP